MAERCNNCGAELFTGQQFCRACGTPTRRFSSEELPTQMLPPNGQDEPPPTATPTTLATSPLPGRHTSDPIYGAGYSRYQPTPASQRATAPVSAPPAPPRKRSHVWVYAVLGLLLFFAGATVVAGLFFLRQPHRVTKVVTRPNIAVPVLPIMPPPPADARGAGAEVSGSQSVITKTYPLAKDGSFALRNFSGDIKVEGWDEQQAEVKIIRRGGGDSERAAVNVVHEEGANRL
ncbi:MAG TPA: zinc ribbon domain-containing protein, partial [Pyrinomonadaceae bacterium]